MPEEGFWELSLSSKRLKPEASIIAVYCPLFCLLQTPTLNICTICKIQCVFKHSFLWLCWYLSSSPVAFQFTTSLLEDPPGLILLLLSLRSFLALQFFFHPTSGLIFPKCTSNHVTSLLQILLGLPFPQITTSPSKVCKTPLS